MATAPATIALDHCPVCSATGGRDFALGGANLRECGSCGTIYSQRYADPDAIYVDGYYTDESGFGIDVRHPRFQAFLADVNAQRARLLTSLTGATGATGSLLDVGCGGGEFMVAMRDRGWSVLGVDPIEESGELARSRGLEVRTAMLADAGVPQGEHDVVSAFHVLEHVPDGPAFLRELAQWARPGGHIVVESPNWNSHLRRTAGDRYLHLRPLEHVVHLEPRTLRLAFERAGLEPVAIRTPTWSWSGHSPTEALADSGRGSLAGLPGPLARIAATAGRALDERRGRGMVVWGLARVPA
jgi:SAM-dependent methyltransferase